MLIARSPVRISFGGGGTDLAAYYRHHGGMVVSATINKYIYGIVTKNFDTTFQVISADYRSILKLPTDGRPLEAGNIELRLCQVAYEHFDPRMPLNVFIASEVPPGTGLGSSSVTCVTLCNIFSTLVGQAMAQSLAGTMAPPAGVPPAPAAPAAPAEEPIEARLAKDRKSVV